MPPKAANPKVARRAASAPEDLETFLAALDHPCKPAILALRQLLLAADQRIAGAIKWNAPSFHTSEHFATMHLRARDHVQLILHLGAKPRDSAAPALAIHDPAALLTWLGKDRASLTFRDADEIDQRRAALTAIIHQWISYI